jgi:hypothetical protein
MFIKLKRKNDGATIFVNTDLVTCIRSLPIDTEGGGSLLTLHPGGQFDFYEVQDTLSWIIGALTANKLVITSERAV